MKSISRRDAIRLLSLTPAALFAKPFLKYSSALPNSTPNNIIVLVFDAWSGSHLALNGYPRLTMPSIEKFAERAIVYHNHYAAGSFTDPGTASLLTGLYPWSHRAFLLGSRITPAHSGHQAFVDFYKEYFTLGYAQNKYADQFLFQVEDYLDEHIRSGLFNLQDNLVYSQPFFRKDANIAFESFDSDIFELRKGFSGSLFVGDIYRLLVLRERLRSINQFDKDYPRGLPDNTENFLLSDVVDGAIDALRGLKSPSFVYLHFYPPHDPYRPTRAFFGRSNKDKWQAASKPIHPLASLGADKAVSSEETTLLRNFYDDYLMSWDAEVSRLFEFLRESGLLDRSYVVVTSDHGEMHERGITFHMTRALFDPLMRIPLLVSQPGQTQRVDVQANTSAVDVLPTLLHLAGKPVSNWIEGTMLPVLGGQVDDQRAVYTLDAKQNGAFGPLTTYSVSMNKGPYRLTRYSYPTYGGYEFYDMANDREELHDLYSSHPSESVAMQAELDEKINQANTPYIR